MTSLVGFTWPCVAIILQFRVKKCNPANRKSLSQSENLRFLLKILLIFDRIGPGDDMEIVYVDEDVVVCVKPARVLSTDEPGGLPDLLRVELGTRDFRTVHRLDRVVSGLMVVARNAAAASELSRQIREDEFEKEYLAVVHGDPGNGGTLKDLLYRDKARKMTMVAREPGKDVQEAILHYKTLGSTDGLSRVRIQLVTGRTHQIRVQFASRNMPLVGERKYAVQDDDCEIALWSYRIAFTHPRRGEKMDFSIEPREDYPWNCFEV
jgi:23S rRNA pseudouridine1911/1915/1917 synthase